MNSVSFVGHLSKDVEVRYTQSGKAVAQFTIAVKRRFAKENGPLADFFPVVVWGNNAEPCGKYLQKGSLCAVKGAMQNRSYDDKDGNKRYITELIADEVEFLQSHKNSTSEADSAEVPEEEIPF